MRRNVNVCRDSIFCDNVGMKFALAPEWGTQQTPGKGRPAFAAYN
jgi:hypothetical protein